MKAEIWGVSTPLRLGIELRIRRVKNYTQEGPSKNSYSTELVCCKKILSIAPCKDESNASFLIRGWYNVIDKILVRASKGEHLKPSDKIENFVREVVNTEQWKEKTK